MSLATQNACAFTKIATFFQTGDLPGKNNYCPLEVGSWNITFAEPLDKRIELREVEKGFYGAEGGIMAWNERR